MNILFMGTPEFAAEILRKLFESKHNIIGVFTQPAKPKGRKMIVTKSAVEILAEQKGMPVFCPCTLKDETIIERISKLSPDVIVVAAYGMILPPEILSIPKYGCVNVHGSLLPKYRGAAPIQWALINGEKETGITIMFMEKTLDSGDIICQKAVKISDNDSAETLFSSLAKLGAIELLHALDLIIQKNFIAQKQYHKAATLAPMLSKNMSLLDFSKSAEETFNLIRGLNLWPVARANILGETIKIFESKVVFNRNLRPNEIEKGKRLIIGCAKDAIELLVVAPANGKKMSGLSFVNGYISRYRNS